MILFYIIYKEMSTVYEKIPKKYSLLNRLRHKGFARLDIFPDKLVIRYDEAGVRGVFFGNGYRTAVDINAVFTLFKSGNVEVPVKKKVVLF